jgi:hypothetical protein
MKWLRKIKNLILFEIILGLILVTFNTAYASPGAWITLDYPDAQQTYIGSVDGSNIAGTYMDTAWNYHGFLYDGANWTTIDEPGVSNTYISGIDGSNLVGSSKLYNMTTQTWTTLNVPGNIYGISGNNLVGNYSIDYGNSYGFLYNQTAQTWVPLSAPGGSNHTWARGIDGDNIVGFYQDAFGKTRGFLYDGTNWTVLDEPLATDTYVYGIDGINLVGTYVASDEYHGFLYNGTTWITLDMPGAHATYIYGISGSNLVGIYDDGSGNYHGFSYEIPEPATIFLLGFGVILAGKKLVR